MARKPFVDWTKPLGDEHRKHDHHRSYANELRLAQGRNRLDDAGTAMIVEAYGGSAEFAYPEDRDGRLAAFLNAADWLYSARRAHDAETTPAKAAEAALERFHEFRGTDRDGPEADVRRLVEGLHEYCLENGIDLETIVADPYAHR